MPSRCVLGPDINARHRSRNTHGAVFDDLARSKTGPYRGNGGRKLRVGTRERYRRLTAWRAVGRQRHTKGRCRYGDPKKAPHAHLLTPLASTHAPRPARESV